MSGYEEYGSNVEAIRHMGLERMANAYLDVQIWGTPAQIIEKLRHRRDVIGDYDLDLCFRYAGMTYDMAEDSMRTFAEEVLPAIHTWRSRDVA